MRLKILVASRDKAALGSLAALIPTGAFDVTCKHVFNGHADPLYGVTDTPDIVIHQVGTSGETDLAEIGDQGATGRPPTIVIGPAGQTTCMRLAMRTGARDYLEDPVSPADLLASLERIQREIGDKQPARSSSLTAVVSSKGGSGASFIAVNLAHIMAAKPGSRVAIVDLDLQFSSLAQYLDLKPEHGLLQALDMGEQLDGVALDAYMARHKSGLAMIGVLEDEMVLTRDIPLERFVHLLNVVQKTFDHVIVDRVLLVLQQEIGNLRDAMRLRNILVRQLGMPEQKLEIVVNRYDKNFQVEVSDIKRALGYERDLMLIPNHYRDVSESINVGVPMLDHQRNSPVTKALLQIEARLAGGPAGDSEPRSKLTRVFANLIKG
jgi:pilus assembly protein CpaE